MVSSKCRRVLMIDDDTELASFLARYVDKHGYQLVHAASPKEGLLELQRVKPEAVLLDISFPDGSGLELCRRVRSSNPVPIIMISALGETADRIVGLEAGADDYLPKPFDPRELVAHLDALFRRAERLSSAGDDEVREVGTVQVDRGRRQVTVDGRLIETTAAEFELLALLIAKPGHVFSRDEILNELKGIDWDAYSRSVDLVVSRLRKKLGDDPKKPRFLKTVWGGGYVFLPPPSERKVS
jgi:DNA-binding response OmpR family regulator